MTGKPTVPRRARAHAERRRGAVHGPLAAYTDAPHDAGFVIELLREPVPDAAAIAEYPLAGGRQDRIPWYLHLRATRTARPAVSMLKGG